MYINLKMKQTQTVEQQSTILKKHQTFLKKFKRFPDKSRKAIYSQLLQLPMNHDNFTQLTKSYPILPEHTLDQRVSFIVGALGRQYPDLANQWLPGMVYPFVRLFKEDPIAAFEISLTFLAGSAKPLLKDYPNPSKQLMKWFGLHLSELEGKVNSMEYPLSAVINPAMIVSMTDVFNREDWLQIFDFLFANPYSPWLYVCILVEMVKSIEESLLKLNSVEKIVLALRKEKNIEVKAVLKRAVKLAGDQIAFLQEIYADTFFPIPKGRYPVIRFVSKSQNQPNNKLLEKREDNRIGELKKNYDGLQNVMEKRVKYGISADEKQIKDRYENIDGQMRQHLQLQKQEHERKVASLKEIQKGLKQKLTTPRKVDNKMARQIIERRGRLEREIDIARKQADSLREMELALMDRVQDAVNIRKRDNLQMNREFKEKQYNYI